MKYEALQEHGPRCLRILQLPSSGYSSDCYDDNETAHRHENLSFVTAKNIMVDTRIFKEVPHSKDIFFSKGAMLMLYNVPESLNCYAFKLFLESLGH